MSGCRRMLRRRLSLEGNRFSAGAKMGSPIDKLRLNN